MYACMYMYEAIKALMVYTFRDLLGLLECAVMWQTLMLEIKV